MNLDGIKKYKWMKAVPGGPAAVKGITAAGIHCGLKPSGDPDLALFVSEKPCRTVAFFTRNKLLGAHIPVFRRKLSKTRGLCGALLVNSKNANCATGKKGEKDNIAVCKTLADKLGIDPETALFASTGVIGKPLPVGKIEKALDSLIAGLEKEKGGDAAARAIMTTDTRPKLTAVRVTEGKNSYVIGGTAKGSGMICPNMATMFSFIFTDADVSPAVLKSAAAGCVKDTFNSISVDGDTSPNDTMLVMANGMSGVKITGGAALERFKTAMDAVAGSLAMEIVRDGEGATKLVHLNITGAKNDKDAEKIARSIAGSQLVKTAIFGEDPNWGRIMSAAGVSGADFDPEKARLHIDGALVYDKGKIPALRKKIMGGRDVIINLNAGIGNGSARFWTCDLSFDYVKINAEYMT